MDVLWSKFPKRPGERRTSLTVTRLNDTDFPGPVIDLDVRVGRGKAQVDARVVRIWNAGAKRYHWYVTSVRASVLAAIEVGTVYALRWQIEVRFKQWKSECKLCDTRTANPDLAMALVYASIAYALLVSLLLAMARRWAGVDRESYSVPRALKVVGPRSTELAEVLSGCGARQRFSEVLERLLGDLVLHSELPNKTRAVLRAAAQIKHP